MSERETAREKAGRLGLRFIELDGYIPDPEAVRLVPRQAAVYLSLVPLAASKNNDNDKNKNNENNGTILIAASEPEDMRIEAELSSTGRQVIIAVAEREDIERNLDRIYNFYRNLNLYHHDFLNSNRDTPLVSYIADFLLDEAVKCRASDMHIEMTSENLARVRFRIDGKLYTKFKYPDIMHPQLINVFKLKGGMNIAENRRPQDGHFLTKIDGRNIDVRLNIFRTVNGEKLAVRILDGRNSRADLENLGFDDHDMKIIKIFCETQCGIVLASGPTGSGKTTTLYSILRTISTPDINIITVEDPVELLIDGINQVQINEKIGVTFASALRAALRQDPDKIMVGEIRDVDTAQTAIRAALTGHFVMSTLHTNDAAGAATRLIEMGVPAFLVASTLSGVIAQRLVRILCPECREEYEIDAQTCEFLNIKTGSHAFRAVGCEACGHTGYKGRTGIFEIMRIDDEIRDMILHGATSMEIRNFAVKNGMRTLRQAGINAAIRGVTSLEEILSVTI